MPKMKTRRALSKRLRMRASGSFKRKKAYHSHILTKKSTKRCRGLRARTAVNDSDQRMAKQQMPYAGK